MIVALRTPALGRGPGPLDYGTFRARALGLAAAYHRRLNGLGLGTAAACARIRPEELDAIEAGAAFPSPAELRALAAVYRTGIADLLDTAGRLFPPGRPG